MKNKRFLFLALTLTLCLLCACGKGQTQPTTPVQPDVPQSAAPTVIPDVPPSAPASVEPTPASPQPIDYSIGLVAGSIPAEDGTVLLTYNLEYPVFDGLNEVNAYYETKVDRMMAECETAADDASEWRDNVTAVNGEFEAFSKELMFDVVRNDGTVLSVQESAYEMVGGPHPNTVFSATTFLTESEGRLLLGDLFTVSESEYLPRLLDAVRTQMDALEQQEGTLYYDTARDDLAQIFNTENFMLGEDTLTLFFNTYDIAPHAVGPQFFDIPFADLADILQDWLTA